MVRISTILLLCLYGLVTGLQLTTISASVVSLLAFVVVGITEFRFPSDLWRPDLHEYWVGVVVWMAVGGIIVRKMVYMIRRRPEQGTAGVAARAFGSTPRWSRYTLLGFAFVAFTAPLLVSVRPEKQADLLSARLLPPFSRGVMQADAATPTSMDSRGAVRGIYAAAASTLLDRSAAIYGESAQLPEHHAEELEGAKGRKQRLVFLCGTDNTGRDVFSRVVFGTRVSLWIGFLAALGAVSIGFVIGALAGWNTWWVDSALMRFTDVFLSVPVLFLAIGMIAFLGQSTLTLVLVLSFTSWMSVARIVRAEVLSLREKEFILAAQLLNVPTIRMVTKHLLPNLKPTLITACVLQFGNAILAESALGFIGLGVRPPTPSWGNMMGEAVSHLQSAWWIAALPGAALSLVLVAAHAFGQKSALPHS